MRKRTQRHDVIREVIRGNAIRTQRDLAEKLQEVGYECTQATISRDIADMGLLKSAEGFYVMPEDMRLIRMVAEMVEHVDVAGHLVVMHTVPGGAAGVAGAIDSAALEGALGTVAGDNTIFLAARTADDAMRIRTEIDDLRRR